MAAQGRLTSDDWDRYDTRQAVFTPKRLTAERLEHGYRWAYREFYKWRSIAQGARAHGDVVAGLRHMAYAGGWKKFEPLWDLVIRAKRATAMLPVLEMILSEFGRRKPAPVALHNPTFDTLRSPRASRGAKGSTYARASSF